MPYFHYREIWTPLKFVGIQLYRDNGVMVRNRIYRKRISFLLSWLMVLYAFYLMFLPTSAAAQTITTLGDTPAAWPSSFTAYTLNDETGLFDPAGEPGISPDEVDFTSGADKGVGNLHSYYVASDGTNMFFRVRLKGDPYDRKGGFLSSVWLVQLGVNGVLKATVGVNGKPTDEDYVYVANANGTAVNSIYKTIAGSSPAAVDGTRISDAENGQYFLDFQVPIARITGIAPDITSSTQIQLNFATSKAANLSVINKDGQSSTPFDGKKIITPSNVNPTQGTAVFIDGGPSQVVKTTTPTITGTTVSAGSNYKVDLQINGYTTSKTNVTQAGTWSVNIPSGAGLTSGSTYTLTARIYSGSSGTILGTATQQLTVITGKTSTNVSISNIGSGAIPTIQGTAEAGDTVTISVDSVVIGQMVADNNGSWSYTLVKLLSQGTHTFDAHAVDVAQNTANATQSYTVSASDVAISIDNGASVTTNDNQPTIRGRTNAPDGSTVQVVITDVYGNSQTYTTTSSSSKWVLEYPTSSKLSDGMYTVQASVTVNGIQASVTQTLTVDTTTFVTIGTLANGSSTNNPTLAITGTTEANATVTINLDNGTTVVTETADGNGNWQYTPTSSLTDGTHNIDVVASDDAGNDAETTSSFTVDTSTSVSISSPTSVSTVTTGTPTITGTTEAGASVSVQIDGGTAAAATVSGTSWSYTPSSALSNGSHTVTATATDAASNTATASSTFTVATTAPSVTISSPTIGSTVTTGTLTITGTTTAGAIVSVLIDGGTSAAASVIGTSWSYTPSSSLSNGSHTVTVTATLSGNTASASSTFTVSTTTPSAPSAPTLSANGTTQTSTTLSWNSVTGATYYNVYENGTLIATGISGTSYNVTGLTTSTTYSFAVSAANTAGESVKSNTVSVTTLANATAPNAPILSAGGTTQTGTTLSWNSVTGATYYNVYENGTLIATGVSGTSYNVTGLTASTTYSFSVSAANAAGESVESNAVNVTTLANATAPSIFDLLVDQGDRVFSVGDTRSLVTTAVYSDQSIQDVTGEATYSTSDASVATVDSKGVITAKAPGTLTITVSFGGKSVAVQYVVQSGKPQVTLNLQAFPDSIVGDGKSQVTLSASVASLSGSPVAGVPVTFHFGTGYPDQTATTDSKGVATVTFTGPALQGVTPVNEVVTTTATDPISRLVVQKSIDIHYMPASVKGVLVDQITGKPIAGATVSVTADFNGDGVIDFSATVTTGADGSYQIYVPRGDWDYTMSIQTSVQIGNKTVPLNMTQTAHVGSLTGTGQDVIASENNISGQLSIAKAGSTVPQASVGSLFGAGTVSAVVQGTAGNSYSKQIMLNSDGSFNVENVPQGQYIIAYQIKAADGTTLAGPLATVNVSQSGQMSIVYSLIDPYGIVTDSATGLPVSGVNMNLYWADTALNRQNGHTPNTLVNLPELTNFAPNENHNPQATDANGAYAWLVFPNADYYIVATKDGYSSYSTLVAKPNVPATNGSDSYIQEGIIHVGQSLVSLNFSLTALPKSSSGSSHSSVQPPLHLAASNVTQTGVLLTWDEVSGADSYTIYGNGQSIAKGATSGSYQVTGLAAGTTYSFTVTAVAGSLESAPSNAVSVTTLLEAANAPANEAQKGEHEKYIEGYPDGTFKPERNVTREEVAAMLFRLYHLTKSGLTGKMYLDVSNADWGADEIEAVSKAGIMNGYPDGTFRPNQPITREEMATTMARLKQLQGKGMDTFSDISDSWARESINAANQAGFIAGYADGTFRPKANTTRAEVVTMINHLANRGPLYGVDTPTWSDVGPNYWAYKDIEEASTNHHYIIQDKKEMRVDVKK